MQIQQGSLLFTINHQMPPELPWKPIKRSLGIPIEEYPWCAFCLPQMVTFLYLVWEAARFVITHEDTVLTANVLRTSLDITPLIYSASSHPWPVGFVLCVIVFFCLTFFFLALIILKWPHNAQDMAGELDAG